jgi:hypothetical protein
VNRWNRRPISNPALLSASTETQRNLKAASSPSSVGQAVLDSFKQVGYKSVDETQVVKVDTAKVLFVMM